MPLSGFFCISLNKLSSRSVLARLYTYHPTPAGNSDTPPFLFCHCHPSPPHGTLKGKLTFPHGLPGLSLPSPVPYPPFLFCIPISHDPLPRLGEDTQFRPTTVSPNCQSWVDPEGFPFNKGQGMVNNAHIGQYFLSSVIKGDSLADVSLLAFREPNRFTAGELHRHKDQWEKLFYYSNGVFEEARYWISNFVHVDKFFTHFKGSYKGANYDCDIPPARAFPNHTSWTSFTQFISDTLLKRLASGAIALWGKVRHCHPPNLVMPLTVEPSKPRLCNDNRFLNLWIQDRPLSLDSIQHLPKYVQSGFYQTVCDDKSGYDHIQLSSLSSRTFFGFEWGGWIFVSYCIPFGWKSSAYIYHTTGLVAFHYLRSLGIPSSLYIDDRHAC